MLSNSLSRSQREASLSAFFDRMNTRIAFRARAASPRKRSPRGIQHNRSRAATHQCRDCRRDDPEAPAPPRHSNPGKPGRDPSTSRDGRHSRHRESALRPGARFDGDIGAKRDHSPDRVWRRRSLRLARSLSAATAIFMLPPARVRADNLTPGTGRLAADNPTIVAQFCV